LVATLPPRCYTGLRYESLVEDTQNELKRICAFLNESFDPAMLDFHNRPDSGFHERESSWKGMTRQPVTSQSVGRFREQLSPRQVALVERICLPTMKRLGYEPVSGWRRFHPLWIVIDTMTHALRKTRRNMVSSR
jgi:hypothetical protein